MPPQWKITIAETIIVMIVSVCFLILLISYVGIVTAHICAALFNMAYFLVAYFIEYNALLLLTFHNNLLLSVLYSSHLYPRSLIKAYMVQVKF